LKQLNTCRNSALYFDNLGADSLNLSNNPGPM